MNLEHFPSANLPGEDDHCSTWSVSGFCLLRLESRHTSASIGALISVRTVELIVDEQNKRKNNDRIGMPSAITVLMQGNSLAIGMILLHSQRSIF